VAAFFLGTKRAIHEQNVIPGMTNRILKWLSHRIFISFKETERFFPKEKTVVTGNPIRSEIAARLLERTERGEGGERFTLLIFGGSAGAHRINEAMMEALDHLQEMKNSVKIIHQTGREDVDFVSGRYMEKGFDALVRPFFEDMATNYRMADLIICRSGASTIAELAVGGKAAILIPYPYAAHGHQLLNAKKLSDVGAARMIRDEELDGSKLALAILHLYVHREELRSMEEAIQKVGQPKAAQEIVEQCYKLLERME
jgi:UDP-N-acetylglucosamine--N-acetylmuramyl-(pentapeptide) pyrophosphoryl-undecaprenol N-acetylglucosamine transferase